MFNTLNILGNLGNNPTLRYFEDGTAVCNFSLATNRRWKGSNGQMQEETTWFRITVYGKQAENCNAFLQSGKHVHVSGRLKPESQTGSPRLCRAMMARWRRHLRWWPIG